MHIHIFVHICICHLVIMTCGVDNSGDGNCHCKAIMGTMHLRISWKIQSVSPIGFPVLLCTFICICICIYICICIHINCIISIFFCFCFCFCCIFVFVVVFLLVFVFAFVFIFVFVFVFVFVKSRALQLGCWGVIISLVTVYLRSQQTKAWI